MASLLKPTNTEAAEAKLFPFNSPDWFDQSAYLCGDVKEVSFSWNKTLWVTSFNFTSTYVFILIKSFLGGSEDHLRS